jgi:hypothetical protein
MQTAEIHAKSLRMVPQGEKMLELEKEPRAINHPDYIFLCKTLGDMIITYDNNLLTFTNWVENIRPLIESLFISILYKVK